MFNISTLDHTAIGVRDLKLSVAWYERVMGLKKLTIKEWGPQPVFMISENNTGIAIFETPHGNPVEATHRKRGLPHIAFRVDMENFNKARDHLNHEGVKFEFQDHHIAYSIYFRDPDDYLIEITTYDLTK
jgi:catechol 2,3-dioxygenase-like lactoylglutathione lyase family enzyme